MFIVTLRSISQPLALFLVLSGAGSIVMAQTPTPTPVNPAQRDATRPPGTEQNQPVPEQGRPIQQDPTAPPGVQRPAPQAPPGTSTAPQTTPVAPGQTTPSTSTVPTVTNPADTSVTNGTPGDQEIREPVLPNATPLPVPPLPNLMRLGINSDSTLTLSLNDAIRRALENNNDIEVARSDVRFAETQLRALQGIYEPIFNITPQINSQTQSQQSTLGGSGQSGSVKTTDFQLNPSVTKLFGTGGGSYDFFFNNNKRTTSSQNNFLNPVYSASLGATFTQPLWRDRSIDNNRRQIRIQRKRLEQSDADFRRRTIDVISQVQRAYWDLVFAQRDQQNRVENLNLTRENFRRTEAQIAAGAAAPFTRAEVQTELANRESDVLQASQSVSIAENNLKQLIIRDPQAKEWSSQVVTTDNPTFDATPVSITDALTEASSNRPELQRLRIQNDISGIDIQYFKNQTKPRIDIQSTIATTGLSGSKTQLALVDPFTGLPRTDIVVPPKLVGGYGQTLRNLFDLSTRNIVVGVAIQIPFRNKTAEANLAGARIQLTQLEASMRSQEQSIEVEVRNAAQAVETSRRRVLAAREARQSAEVQLQGEQRLYAVGRSTTFLLFQRENQLANARNLELRAETDYNKSLADLQRATSTTLRANNVIVETPAGP